MSPKFCGKDVEQGPNISTSLVTSMAGAGVTSVQKKTTTTSSMKCMDRYAGKDVKMSLVDSRS